VPQDGAQMCVKLIERYQLFTSQPPKCHKLMHKHKTSLLKIAFRIIFTKNLKQDDTTEGMLRGGEGGGKGAGKRRQSRCLSMKSENWVNLMQLPTQRADVESFIVVYPAADATNM